MIKVRSYDLKSILALSILKLFIFILGLMIFITSKDDNSHFMIYGLIVLGIIILISISQLVIYLVTFKKIVINDKGIIIFKKTNNKTILWKEIKLFTYYSEIVVLEPNTLKIKCHDNKILLGRNYSDIHISLKKYKEAIKLIPNEIVKNNELLLYETPFLLKQDKYKLFKEHSKEETSIKNK